MLVKVLVVALSVLCGAVNCIEPFTTAAAAVAIAAALGGGGYYSTYCRREECCYQNYWNKWIAYNYTGLRQGLQEVVFGQHIVLQTLPNVIKNHVEKAHPGKALVLSFHGSTGTGKNYVADVIVRHLYRLGTASKFVHKVIATDMFSHSRDYENATKVDEYRAYLKQLVVSETKTCGVSTFIFDEADKMPEGVFDVLKPYVDYHTHVDNVDFRRNIFIFLSNKPGDEINEEVSRHFKDGKVREDLSPKYMEEMLQFGVYNIANGLRNAALIQSKLIDFYIPFLPLERKHVVQCALAELRKRGMPQDEAVARKAAGELKYVGPAEFSTTGCKLVIAKLDVYLS